MVIVTSTIMLYLFNVFGSLFTLKRLEFFSDNLYNPKLKLKEHKTQYNILQYICAPVMIANVFDSTLLRILSRIVMICFPINMIIALIGLITKSAIIYIILVYLSFIIIGIVYISNIIIIAYISKLGETIYPILGGIIMPSIGYYLLLPALYTFFDKNKNILKGD